MKEVVPIDGVGVTASASASIDLCSHYSTSAPSSPELAASVCTHFSAVTGYLPPSPASGVPFSCEDKPGTPKLHLLDAEKVEEPMLKLPPRLLYPAADGKARTAVSSPRSPLLSPRRLLGSAHRRIGSGGGGGGGVKELDPFTITILKASGREKAPPVNLSDRGRNDKWRLRDLPHLLRSASPKPAGSHRIARLLNSWGSIKKKVEAEEGHNRDFCAEDDGATAATAEEMMTKKTPTDRRSMKEVVPIDGVGITASASASIDLCCHYSTSAPSSPELVASICTHFSAVPGHLPPSPASGVPFHWEDKPGTPKFHLVDADKAEEPMLKPPPRVLYPAADGKARTAVSSPRSPLMSPSRLWGLAHRSRGSGAAGGGGGGGMKKLDPFTIAILEASGRDKAPPVNSSDRGRNDKWRLRDLPHLLRSASPKLAGSHSTARLLNSWGSLKKKVVAEEGHDRDFCAEDHGATAATAEEMMNKKNELHLRLGMLGCILYNAGGRRRLDRSR